MSAWVGRCSMMRRCGRLVYAKNERVELTPADKKMLRELVKQLEGGE
ncbi:MAG: hypothetical protein ACYC3F_07325 [Gemmatimonadaceae bacterium]